MTYFKVGDYVKYTAGSSIYVTNNKIYKIVQLHDRSELFVRVINDQGKPWWADIRDLHRIVFQSTFEKEMYEIKSLGYASKIKSISKT